MIAKPYDLSKPCRLSIVLPAMILAGLAGAGAADRARLAGRSPSHLGVSRAIEGTYHIEAGDVLEIRVEGEPDISGPRRVRPDGGLDLPLIGTVEASHRSTQSLADQIRGRLREFLIDPTVSVGVIEPNPTPITVYVVGEVESPGPVPLPRGGRLLDAIRGAGGLTTMADYGSVEAIRDGDALIMDLGSVFRPGASVPNPALGDGETVRVPRAREKFVYVLGEVHRPGPVANHHPQAPLTVAEALTLAGGPTSEARLKEIFIVRIGPEGRKIHSGWDLKKSLRSDRDRSLALHPGDIVYAPPKRGVRFRRGIGNIFPFLGEATRSVAAGAAVQ